MKRIVVALAMVAALGGCSILKGRGDKGPKTAVLGERIPVLTTANDSAVEPSLADIPVTVPEAAVNDSWTQPGGNQAKSMGNPALAPALNDVWSTSIPGGPNKQRLAAPPVVAGGKLFVVDGDGFVRAFDAKSGARLWQTQLDTNGRDKVVQFGGGASVDDGRVYATNGRGDAAALDIATGKILWKVRPAGVLRGAPGVFGVAAPASAQGTVVAGFSSGELNAYRYENGRSLWGDVLTRTSMSTSVSSLSDIDAEPVIDQGRVYAVGQGGRMVAMDIATGNPIWEQNIAGISSPWAAGEWLFVVTDDARLMCLSRGNGKARWIVQLKHYKNPKKPKNPISWEGPVLAGGRLLLVKRDA
jgi:outer membrane protein assembly factor BamB